MRERSVQVPILGQGERPAGTQIRVGTVNVGTMNKKSHEVAEMLSRRKVDICCLQETRWRGGSARKIQGRDSTYKFFWCGSDSSGFGGVGIMLAEKWIDAVISVDRHNHRCLQLRLQIGTVIMNFICCYAPQTGLSSDEKDTFYDQVLSLVAAVPDDEFLLIGGDFNGHVGESSGGFEDTHGGGHGYGIRNSDGVRMLDFCVANRLAIANTFFKKKHSRLITYSSGGADTQIDFLVVKRSNLRHVKNVNVVRTEECISQLKLLIGDIMLSTKPR